MATATKTVSYEEWLRLPVVSDAIEEVVNGEIRTIPPNKWPHAQAVQRLERQMLPQVDPDEVEVVTANFGLVIRKQPLTSRVPDLAVFRIASLVEIDGYIHSAPELAVEVLSPSDTHGERLGKLADYAAIDVPEVWFLSPEAQTVEIFHLADGALKSVAVLTSGKISPLHFPQVSVDIERIWLR